MSAVRTTRPWLYCVRDDDEILAAISRAVQRCAKGVSVNAIESISAARCFHDPSYPSTEPQNAEQRALVADFNRRLAAGEIATETVPCLCGGQDFALFATYERYRVRQDSVICKRCGLLQSRPRLSPESYRWFYESDFYRRLYNPDLMGGDVDRFRDVTHSRLYRFEFVRERANLAAIGSVLEIGCGAGWNLEPYHVAGKRVVGYDQGPTLVAFGRTQGLNLREGSVEDVGDDTFDLIILSHVVEHFPDPIGTVQQVAGRLNPGGHIYIEVPDADEFALGGLQTAHTYWFSKRTLVHYMARAGLKANEIRNFGCHVGGLFEKSPDPPMPSLDGEYERMRATIRRYGRRQDAKDLLGCVGLLGIVRWLRG